MLVLLLVREVIVAPKLNLGACERGDFVNLLANCMARNKILQSRSYDRVQFYLPNCHAVDSDRRHWPQKRVRLGGIIVDFSPGGPVDERWRRYWHYWQLLAVLLAVLLGVLGGDPIAVGAAAAGEVGVVLDPPSPF